MLSIFIDIPSSSRPSITNIPYSRSISKRPGSCSTVVGDETHFTLPRPKLRARGMTDGGSTQKSGFFSDERPTSQKASTSTLSPPISSTEHNSPRVVIQQASLSRITGPPCAPPAHSLPAAPHSPPRLSSPMQTSKPLATNPISTSSISFVSSSSHEVLPTLSHPLREKRYSERSVFSQDHDPGISSTPTKRESKTAPSSPRRLKKPLSHQSLTSKSNIQPSTPPKLPPENIVDKVFRKQRALPHTHSPIPPIPNPVGQPSSTNHTTPPLTDSVKAATERRTSGNSSLGRKRLFSHSGAARPSISHPLSATTQDDSLSVFSLRSDRSSNLVPLKPWASPKVTPQSSFWDEVGSPAPSSPARSTSEYMLQPILSAAEVAKLEASIENLPGQSTRGRTLSASTTVSEDLDFTPAGLSPRPTTRPRSKGSMTGKSPAVKNPALYSPVSSRAQSPSPPSPNNENHENDPRNTRMYHSFSSELAASLPLPPRLRQRPQLVFRPERSNTAPLNLSPVAKPSRSKSAVEKSTHRRSIMRKPSFLEIDDDTDQDIDLFSGEATTHSFLDLARESFEMNHRDDP